MQKKTVKRSNRAFTIIELLCILAIIALLVAILMPALSKAREQSTQIQCASNLNLFAKTGIMYLNDNDEYYPKGPENWLFSNKAASGDHPLGCRWHDRLMAPTGKTMRANPEYQGAMWSYFNEMSMPICPTFRRFGDARGCENKNHNRNIDIEPQNSYSINGYLGSERQGGALRSSEVSSRVFFFAEENPWTVRPDHPRHPAKWLTAPLSTTALDDNVLLITPTPKADGCFATYHSNKSQEGLNSGVSNIAFVDGHVKKYSVGVQLRNNMHKGSNPDRSGYSYSRRSSSSDNPAGNLHMAWASKTPPPGGWESQ